MPGTEVELIQPLTADHYISELSIEPHHIAHMGLHVDDEAHHQRVARLLGLWRQVFSIRTTDHLSPAVPENRRYQYDDPSLIAAALPGEADRALHRLMSENTGQGSSGSWRDDEKDTTRELAEG